MRADALTRAAVLGYAVGVRSMTPLAALSWGAGAGEISLKGTPFQFLANPKVTLGLTVAAAGEMLADKLPFVPSRTNPYPLAFRVLNGAVTGAVLFESEDEPVAVGAAVGAAGAVIGSFAGYWLRTLLQKQAGMPNLVAGIVGDVQSVSLSMAAVTGDVSIPALKNTTFSVQSVPSVKRATARFVKGL